MSLDQAPLSQQLCVTGIRGNSPIAYRLMDMGFIKGALVEILGRAPLGDPLRVRINDYIIAIRCEEAGLIDVVDV